MSFENASVIKGFMVTYGISSILAGIFDVKYYFHLQLVPHISRYHQYWRLVTHHLVFTNSSDLFIALLILFNCGVQVERQFGSVKFASFAIVSTLLVTAMEVLVLMLLHRVGPNHIASGPVAFLFSLLYQFSRIVPSTYHYRIFGLPLTNKSTLYALALQLAISRPPTSVVVALIGILAGQIYRSDLANLNGYRVSPSAVKFCTRFVLPLLGSFRPPRRTNRALPDDSPIPSPAAHHSSGQENENENEEVITTTRSGPLSDPGASTTASSSSSVVREWVNELTGRGEGTSRGLGLSPSASAAGIHLPSEQQIVELTTIFPNIRRDVIVGALQHSTSFEAAVETLLNSPTP